MAVQTTLASLSQTASSNGPDGTVDAPSTLDDSIRYHGAFIAQLRDGSGFSFALSFRNRLINGNCAVNQLPVSGTVVLAAGAYGHDGWKAGAGGCTYTFAASGNDTILTISAGSLMQVIEDKNVEGSVYALANRGTATARIAVNGAATSGAYSTASTAVPLASASATGGQTVTVEFSTGTIDRAQLEPGTVATPFERRPIGMETALCQRYYETGFVRMDTYGTTGALIGTTINYKATKRVLPTVAAPGIGYSNASGFAVDASSTVQGFEGTAVVTTTGSAAFAGTWTASARL